MKKLKNKVTLFGAVIIMILLFAGFKNPNSNIKVELLQNNDEAIKIQLSGGKPPYTVLLSGERFDLQQYESDYININKPEKGKYILIVHDSKTGHEYLIFEVK